MASGPTGKITPMIAQYLKIKAQHPGALLLFRMGDFFETFFDDAKTLADVAGVTLTSRDSKSEHPVPLAGVPHHAIDTYLNRLLEAGLTVAICEQVEDPAEAKGLVKREVVEVISPGTATSPELVEGRSGVYCLAWAASDTGASGWALLDASTGEFRCGREDADLSTLCERHAVREVIVSETTDGSRLSEWRRLLPGVVVNTVSDAWFHPSFGERALRDHFGVRDLAPFGLDGDDRANALSAAGSVLRYLTSLTLGKPVQISSLRYCPRSTRLLLDEETLRNLEVFRTFRGERGEGTLIHHIDATRTPMGRRLLERRLAEALTDLESLDRWHGGIAGLLAAPEWRSRLAAVLDDIGDLPRWAARVASGRIGPRQLRQLAESIVAVMRLPETVRDGTEEHDGPPHPIDLWAQHLPALGELTSRIRDTLAEDPPALVRAGGCIAAGVDEELDRCRAIASDTKGFLAGMQANERRSTGISTLKIGYNKVFGYYFDVTRKHLEKVPEHYRQKQTLVNSCRFVTDELKEAENTILDAEERASALEATVFGEIVALAARHYDEILVAGSLCGRIDLMTAFADKAADAGFCRPECDDSLTLDIRQGRHLVVEELLDRDFIANDTLLDGDRQQLLLLTGPNMGGKSTYLRQVALITLLAQAGSWVPAASARIGVADRIFTRVGASDNVARGESTFYSEMSETARILHQMSRRSLVILDEIGRGTSTYDGLSLAWAITEFLQEPKGPRPRSVFATHYHELTELESSLPGLVNLRLEVREWEGKIIFLHSVKPGRSDQSYGIHVARLAGIPETVLRRASAILENLTLEDRRAMEDGQFSPAPGGASIAADAPTAQLSLFSENERDALDALRDVELDRLSPVDAFMWLMRIKERIDD